MASPLRWFRRHAKILMVVLGSAAMAIFGLGNVLTSLSDPAAFRAKPEDQVLAKWNGGDITRNDISAMQTQHYQTQRFLYELESQATELKKDDFRSLAQPISPLRGGERSGQSEVDEQLIERFILAKKAEKEGIVVSDGVIDDYLQMASSYAGFSKNDLVRINQSANQGRCSLEAIKRHLRLELLSQQMRMYTLAGLPMVPNPIEAVGLYQQLNETVECEVFPVSVEDYFAKLDESAPTMELKKLYEEGKYDYPDPTGKKPGFKRPNKISLQYLTADMETFMLNEMNKLTDEQVQAEYDRLVKEKADLVMEIVADESAETDSTTETETPAETDAASTTEGSAETLETDASAPEDTDPENSDGESEGAIEFDGGIPPAALPSDDEQSLIVRDRKSVFASVNVQEIPGEVQGVAEDVPANPIRQEVASESSGTEDMAVTEEAPVVEEATDEKPAAGEEPARAESATEEEEEKQEEEKQEEEAKEETEAEEEVGSMFDDAAEEKQTEKQVLPLKDVADKVKRSLVQKDAFKAMEESTKKVTALMTGYHTLRMKWEFTDEKKLGEVPEPLDINELADRYNLIAKETGLLDYAELSATPFGMTDVPISVPGPNGRPQMQFVTVSRVVFDRFDDLKVYDAQTAQDFRSGNSIVYWLAEKVDAEVPATLEGCKPEVEKFWKSQRAMELAKDEAAKIAEKINRDHSSLTEVYGDRVLATGEFSWFNTLGGSLYGQPQGVDKPGEAFMKSVFSLEKMGAGVAENQPKTTVYVVQMVSERASTEELGKEYIEQKYLPTKRVPRDVSALSTFYGREINIEWNQELADEMGLKIYGR